MKKLILLFVLFLVINPIFAQITYFDSLKENLIQTQKEDTNQVIALFYVADYYGFIQFDSCLHYALRNEDNYQIE